MARKRVNPFSVRPWDSWGDEHSSWAMRHPSGYDERYPTKAAALARAEALKPTLAREGIETTYEQMAAAYDKVQAEKKRGRRAVAWPPKKIVWRDLDADQIRAIRDEAHRQRDEEWFQKAVRALRRRLSRDRGR